MSSANMVHLRLRENEAVKLGILKRAFHENLEATNLGQEVPGNRAMKLFVNMSRHQMIHVLISFAYLKQHELIPLMAAMAKAGCSSIEEFLEVHGSIEEFENCRDNYVDFITQNGPLSTEQYERLKKEFEQGDSAG